MKNVLQGKEKGGRRHQGERASEEVCLPAAVDSVDLFLLDVRPKHVEDDDDDDDAEDIDEGAASAQRSSVAVH